MPKVLISSGCGIFQKGGQTSWPVPSAGWPTAAPSRGHSSQSRRLRTVFHAGLFTVGATSVSWTLCQQDLSAHAPEGHPAEGKAVCGHRALDLHSGPWRGCSPSSPRGCPESTVLVWDPPRAPVPRVFFATHTVFSRSPLLLTLGSPRPAATLLRSGQLRRTWQGRRTVPVHPQW